MPVVDRSTKQNNYSLAPLMGTSDVERVLTELNDLNASGVRCLFGKWGEDESNGAIHNNKKKPTINYYFKDIHHAIDFSHKNPSAIGKRNHRFWDWYISINSFSSWSRGNQNVIGLNGLWCDIDLTEHGISIPNFVIHIDEILKLAQLSNPNLVIVSGHGVYFVWLFARQMIANAKSFKHFWQRMEWYRENRAYWKHGKKHHKIIETGVVSRVNSACQKIFGCEPVDTGATDPARVLRLFGTNNMKNYRNDHAKCQLIRADFHRFSMYAWADELLPKYTYNHNNPAGRTHKRPKKRRHSKVITFRPHNYGPMSLFWSRHDDMHHLAKVAGKGIRENLLFFLACFDSKIKNVHGMDKDIEATNRSMPEPLPDSEITNLEQEYRHINFAKYKFSNRKIIQLLKLSANFQEHAETIKEKRYCHGTKPNAHHGTHPSKWKHRQQAKARYRHEVEARHQKIMELLSAGLSVRKVHKKLHVSVGLISKMNQKRKREHARKQKAKAVPRSVTTIGSRYSPPPHETCPYFKIRLMLLNDTPINMISKALNITEDLVKEVDKKWNTTTGKQKLLARIIQLERQKHGIR